MSGFFCKVRMPFHPETEFGQKRFDPLMKLGIIIVNLYGVSHALISFGSFGGPDSVNRLTIGDWGSRRC